MERLYRKKSCVSLGTGYFYYIDFEQNGFENPNCKAVYKSNNKIYVPVMIQGNQMIYIDDGKLISYNLSEKTPPALIGQSSNEIEKCFVENATDSHNRDVDTVHEYSYNSPGDIINGLFYSLYTCEGEEQRAEFNKIEFFSLIRYINNECIHDGKLSVKCPPNRVELYLDDKKITAEQVLDLIMVRTKATETISRDNYESIDTSGGTKTSWWVIIILAVVLYWIIKCL